MKHIFSHSTMRGGHPEAGVPAERKSEDQTDVQQRVGNEEKEKEKKTHPVSPVAGVIAIGLTIEVLHSE